ncbi:mitochondrial inner membrane protein OXA1L-like [Schistocerca gregaria]|uniref:mitochondrial inner membrane protein OXA1L-like n=1 Tax=Schistocerca gregaria TaxID=7010 RepID=UPI00211E2678|nr:mitochondrial inner membrane protein OXA1L-like [Schistocerca gregaria]
MDQSTLSRSQPTKTSLTLWSSTTPPPPSTSLLPPNQGYARLADISNYAYPWDPALYFIEGTFELLQTATNFPWWISIFALAAITRTLLLPLAIKQMRITSTMEQIQPQIDALRKKALYQMTLKTPDGKRDWTPTIQLQQEITQLMKNHNVSPFSALKFSIPQAVSLVTTFITLNRIARNPDHALHHLLQTGGDFWFRDLTLCDPYFIFPALSMFSTAGLILVTPMPGRSTTFITWTLIIISGTTLFFTYSFPVTVHLFWIGSNTLSMLTTIALRTNYVRKLLNFPVNPSQLLTKIKTYDSPPPSSIRNRSRPSSQTMS